MSAYGGTRCSCLSWSWRAGAAERSNLALWTAGLNLLAFAVAMGQFFFGLERFFPENEVTELIYKSHDVADNTAFRIPASFVNAHAYAGTMVMTLPLLVGAWVQPQRRAWHWRLLLVALVATLLGIFVAGPRLHVVVAFILVSVVLVSSSSRFVYRRAGWRSSGRSPG